MLHKYSGFVLFSEKIFRWLSLTFVCKKDNIFADFSLKGDHFRWPYFLIYIYAFTEKHSMIFHTNTMWKRTYMQTKRLCWKMLKGKLKFTDHFNQKNLVHYQNNTNINSNLNVMNDWRNVQRNHVRKVLAGLIQLSYISTSWLFLTIFMKIMLSWPI